MVPGQILVGRRSWVVDCGFQLWKVRYVQVLIITEVWMQGDSSEACREARIGSDVNSPKSDFFSIFCHWESSRQPDVAHGLYVVQAYCNVINRRSKLRMIKLFANVTLCYVPSSAMSNPRPSWWFCAAQFSFCCSKSALHTDNLSLF